MCSIDAVVIVLSVGKGAVTYMHTALLLEEIQTAKSQAKHLNS